jgi:glycosyltransferase involved in cell wall biosynthesis
MMKILTALSKSNDVIVYCRGNPEGSTVIRENTRGSLKVHRLGLMNHYARPLLDIMVHRLLKKAYRRDKFDVLQVENSRGSIFVMLQTAFPRVGVFHGRLTKELSYSVSEAFRRKESGNLLGSSYRNLYTNISERVMASKSTSLIVTSPLVEQYAIGLGAESTRVFEVVNGVDLQEYDSYARSTTKNDLRLKLGISPNELVYVFQGRLDWDQNVRAVEEIIRFRDYSSMHDYDGHLRRRFLIVGGPNRRAMEFKRELATCDNITFTGYVQDVKPYLFAADIGIAPFPDNVEVGGPHIKILEFLAAGLPVITTAGGIRGMEEIVKEQPVKIVRNADEFCRLKIFEAKVMKTRLQHFDWSRLAAENERILKEATLGSFVPA